MVSLFFLCFVFEYVEGSKYMIDLTRKFEDMTFYEWLQSNDMSTLFHDILKLLKIENFISWYSEATENRD